MLNKNLIIFFFILLVLIYFNINLNKFYDIESFEILLRTYLLPTKNRF